VKPTPQEILDLSGSGHDGTAYGSSFLVPGIKGSALFLNGKGSYVKVNDSKLLNLSEFTLEAWVYLDTNSTYVNPIISKWYGGGYPSQDQFILAMYPTLNQVYLYLSDGRKIFSVNTNTCPTYQWIYIAATYDGQYARIYFNGSLVIQREWIGPIATSNTSIYVGSKSPEVEPQYFNGLVDEVRIYNRALNSTEISYSYQHLTPFSEEGLVLWYSFDG
jgi:hypothetical protein